MKPLSAGLGRPFSPVSVKGELLSIKDKPRCERCKPFIDHLKREVNDLKDKYRSLKFEREDLLRKIKMLGNEVESLEVLVTDLRHEIARPRQEYTEEDGQDAISPQYSQDSLPELERFKLKPKSQGPRNWSFRN